MGNSHSMVQVLQALLKERGLKVSKATLETFISEVDRVAAWFTTTGSFTIPSWERLGKDLEREAQNGKLRAGVRPLWKLVKSCLQDKQCEEAVKAGQKILNNIQESMSETERSEKIGARKKDKYKREKGKEPRPCKLKKPADEKGSLYPVKELEALGFSSSEEEDLEEEVAGCEADRYGPGLAKAKEGSAPPPYGNNECGYSFCPPDTRRKIAQMYPVFEADHVRSYQPVEHKQVKELAESVRTYGVSASYTLSQIERLLASALTPSDWMFVTKACLSMGQYLEWKSIWHGYCQGQA